MKKLLCKIDRFIGIAALLTVIFVIAHISALSIKPPYLGNFPCESIHEGMENVNTVVLAEMKSTYGQKTKFEMSEILRGDMREKTFWVRFYSEYLEKGKTYMLFLEKRDRVTESGETYHIVNKNAVFEVKEGGDLTAITRQGDKYLKETGSTLSDMEIFLKEYTFSPVPPVYDTMNSLEELWEKADNVSVVRHYIDKHSSQTAMTVLNVMTLKGEKDTAITRVTGTAESPLEDFGLYIMFLKNRGTDADDWQLLTRYDSVYPIDSGEARDIFKMAGYEDFYRA